MRQGKGHALAPGGKVHTVSPSGGKKALRGWNFQISTFFEISSNQMGPDPDDAKPRCPRRARKEEGAVEAPSGESDLNKLASLKQVG